MAGVVGFSLNGRDVEVPAEGSLLDALRDGLGVRSPKDGCAPQGQCGCCTVWVDGQPRVSCVTPVARVAGRAVTTVEGLADGVGDRWAEALCATGGSQCGFCTPGIVMRLAALPTPVTDMAARQALLAHVCRCTGWQTILDAAALATGGPAAADPAHPADPGTADRVAGDAAAGSDPGGVARGVRSEGDPAGSGEGGGSDTSKDRAAVGGSDPGGVASGVRSGGDPAGSGEGGGSDTSRGQAAAARSGLLGGGRDVTAAQRRAALEGGAAQQVGPHVALGRGGFADDVAPAGALVAMRTADGEWALGETVAAARRAAGKVQGRKSTIGLRWPLEPPSGEWARTLQTTWVEPAYLEPDAAWCAPGGQPVGPLTNGGAFGAKHPERSGATGTASVVDVGATARRLADEHGRPVRVLLAREDAVRLTPKRPPIAAGVRADGSGIVRVARTAGVAAAIAAVAPGITVEEVDLPGPPTSVDLRGAGWVEAAVLLAAVAADAPVGPDGVRIDEVTAPNGARAAAWLGADGAVHVRVRCGAVLDEVVLRSYCIGAAHMALGWVRGEGIAVDADGVVHDLTIRSFGVIRAVDTPRFEIEIESDDSVPVNGSDAVFAAVAAATWRHAGYPPAWPTSR